MSSRPSKQGFLALPAVGVSLLPKVVCPVCSAAYVAVLSSLGLGLLTSTRSLVVVTSLLLSVAVGALFYGASGRRGHWRFFMGLVAAGCVIAGKFWIDSPTATIAGVVLLVCASVWNAAPPRKAM